MRADEVRGGPVQPSTHHSAGNVYCPEVHHAPRRLAAACATVIALSGLSSLVGGPVLAAAPTRTADGAGACDPGWTTPGAGMPRSMWADVVTAGSEAWAVGFKTPGHDARTPLAAHWDGSSWTTLPVPKPTDETGLYGVGRSPSGRLWAVGYDTHDRVYRPLVARWNGTGFDRMRVPSFRGYGAALVGVTVPDERIVWAVGFREGDHGELPLALRRQAGAWSVLSPRVPAGTTASLLGVDSVGPNDVWAVGWTSAHAAPPRPYITQWNGVAWHDVPAGHVSKGEAVLTDISVVSGNRAWAVGYRLADGIYLPLVQRWNGRTWKTLPAPPLAGPISMLRGVAADPAGGALVVGTHWDAQTQEFVGVAMRWDGSAWGPASAPELTGSSDFQQAAPTTQGRAVVVGSMDGQTLAVDWCPGQATADTAPTEPGPSSTPAASSAADLSTAESTSGGPAGQTATTGQTGQTATTGPMAILSGAGLLSTSSGLDAEAPPSGPALAGSAKPGQRPRAAESIVAREVSRQAGLAETTYTYGGTTGDFNGDGLPDLFISRHAGEGWLALNDGSGHFTEAPGHMFPAADRHGCSAADVNADGRLDLYCVEGALRGAAMKTNELWIQGADGTFHDAGVPWQAADPLGRGRQVTFFDLNHDGRPDLFLANKPPRTDGLPSRDAVLLGAPGDHFVPSSVSGFDPVAGADCLKAVDLDGDGWQDIILCSKVLNRPHGYGLQILHNDHGTLRDITARSGVARQADVDAIAADMNGDGRPDLVQITTRRLRVSLQLADGRFGRAFETHIKLGKAVAAGDVNGDGALDLYVVQGRRGANTPDMVLINDGTGLRFRPMHVPDTAAGGPDAVIPIDYDGNGLTDFVVLNGQGSPGRVEVIAFFPTAK